jgi:hypothetical protein
MFEIFDTIDSIVNIFVSALLALFTAFMVVGLLSNKESSDESVDSKDNRIEMGYVGFTPSLNVLGRRYVFLFVFIGALIVFQFICSSLTYTVGR